MEPDTASGCSDLGFALHPSAVMCACKPDTLVGKVVSPAVMLSPLLDMIRVQFKKLIKWRSRKSLRTVTHRLQGRCVVSGVSGSVVLM